jgi:hypothetical protein
VPHLLAHDLQIKVADNPLEQTAQRLHIAQGLSPATGRIHQPFCADNHKRAFANENAATEEIFFEPTAAQNRIKKLNLQYSIGIKGVSTAPAGYSFALKESPFALSGVPFALSGVPFALSEVPFALNGVSFALNGCPFAPKATPFALNGCPFGVKGVPFAPNATPFAVKGVAFALKGAALMTGNTKK